VSFGSRLGSIAKDLAGAAFATPKFIWDVANAPFNDDEKFNGLSNTLKSAAANNIISVTKPLVNVGETALGAPGVKPALEGINKFNQEVIREPLTAVTLFEGQAKKKVFQGDILGAAKTFFDPNELKKAYQGAQDISFGQALVSGYRNIYDKDFDIYDPAQRDAAFKKSFWGKATTGTIDLGLQLFGDVTLAAGKGAKVLKASEYGIGAIKNAADATKAAEEIAKAQIAGEVNRFTKPLEDFAKNDAIYAINHPMVKSSNNPPLLAHLLGESKNVEEVGDVLRSALGDSKAMEDLTLRRADMADALKKARGDLDAVQEHYLYSAPNESGFIPFINENPAVIQEAKDNLSALAKNDKRFNEMLQLGRGGGSLTRTTGTVSNKLDNAIASSRATKFFDKSIGNNKIDIYQPTPYHKLYQKVSWAAGETPSGMVDFNDVNSYKEITATLDKALKSQLPDAVQGKVPKSLRRLDALEPDEAANILKNYMAASTPELRGKVVLNMEETIVRRLAAKHGVDDEVARKLYAEISGARTSAMDSIKNNGFMVDVDGSIIDVPQLESQFIDSMPIMDFNLLDRLLRRNASSLNLIASPAGRGIDTFVHAADLMQDMFKAGALLRLGYTIRNGVDSQARIAAATGALTSIQFLGQGMKNVLFNTTKKAERLVDNYKPAEGSKMTYGQLAKDNNALITKIKTGSAEVLQLAKQVEKEPNNTTLAIKLNTLQDILAEQRAVYEHNVDVLAKNKSASPKKTIGEGSIEFTAMDGTKYILPDAFGGKLGPMFRSLNSSARTFQNTVDSNYNLINKNFTSKGIGAVQPGAVNYFDAWTQTLNRQFANSAVVKMINEGKTLPEITRWLTGSPAGRDLRRRLGINTEETAEYVTRINNFYDTYLPVSSGLRSKIGDITPNDLRQAFKDPNELPVIHGNVVENNISNMDIIKPRNIINSMFKFLGTMPEDAWARNPLYVKSYRQEVKRRLDVMEGLNQRTVSKAEQEEIYFAAQQVAMKQVKDVLYNIERRSNLAAALKYISPFFSAQENAYKTWSKLAISHPALVNRGNNIWNSPNREGLVTDENGKEVPAGETTGNDVIWVQIPKGLTKLPFVGGGLESMNQMGIPKQSLDVIFQGGMDVLYNEGKGKIFSDIFPVGPYVAMPINNIAKDRPDLEAAFKWALPYGTTRSDVAALQPAWWKRLKTKSEDMDNAEYGRTWQIIWNTEQINARKEGRAPVSAETIERMTQDYYKMRLIANVILPFAPKFNSPYRLYMDKYRQYRREGNTIDQNGLTVTPDQRFFKAFPEFFQFAQSLSENKTGVNSSVAAYKNIQDNKSLVGKLNGVNPSMIGLMVNDPNGYEFSQTAYNWLYNEKVAPGSKETFLGTKDPVLAQQQNEAKKGWIQYQASINNLDAELEKRGLTSYSQKGAEDLDFLKSVVIDKLSKNADGSPSAWYIDYKDTDGSKTIKSIEGLKLILGDEKFMSKNSNNPMWKSAALYLEIRDKIAAELSNRDVKSIDAKANADLRFIYDTIVKRMTNESQGFKDLYDRFLSQDLVYDKYLTPKAVQ
jgi:hypothetical protein